MDTLTVLLMIIEFAIYLNTRSMAERAKARVRK
jgi:hypothetical protein